MNTRVFFGYSAWLLVVLGLLLMLNGCGSSYYLAVQPQELEGEAINGPQTLFAELDGVEMELTFSHFRIKDTVFEVEIRNGSSQPVLVDPGSFYYQLSATQAAPSTADTSSSLPPVPAYDPEAEVQPLSTRLRLDNGAVIGVSEIEWMIIMAHVTKEAMGKKQREARKTGYGSQKTTPPQPLNEAQKRAGGDKIMQELALWQGALLRRYNLQPGELIRGYVVFPGYAQSAVLRLITPVGPHVFTFDYSQKRLKY